MPGTGPGGRWTTADIGYDDPILLAQLNGDYTGSAGVGGGDTVRYSSPFINPPPPPVVVGQPGGVGYNPPPGQGAGILPANAPIVNNSFAGSMSPALGMGLFGGGPSPSNGLSVGGVIGGVLGTIDPCQYLPATLQAGCRGIQGTVTSQLTTSGKVSGCPAGYVQNSSGQCVTAGASGTIQRVLPGGKTGTMSDAAGQATMGAFNMPAMVPAQVGVISNNRGESSAVLRCPRGTILGRDNLCYLKGSLPRAWRKWAPQPRPILSAHDGKVLRQAAGLKKKVKKAAHGAGLHMATRSHPVARKRK